jgi:hypothetical protein
VECYLFLLNLNKVLYLHLLILLEHLLVFFLERELTLYLHHHLLMLLLKILKKNLLDLLSCQCQ